MRRYWQPVALSRELPPGGAPLPVRVMGEDLVLFRDDEGKPGLLGLHCAHRGADLSYGRVEDGGLRCIYHGWLYDRNGRCVEQPGEPAGSTFHERIRQTAYPCQERAGAVFAYLGPGEPPVLPLYDFMNVPDDQVFVAKLFADCNYLQGHEGNIDFLHPSFLHYGPRAFPGHVGNSLNGAEKEVLDSRGAAPYKEKIEAHLVDFGLWLARIRALNDDIHEVCLGSFVMPGFTVVWPGQLNWHVAIDDTHHWKYTFLFNREKPLDYARHTDRIKQAPAPDYRPIANKGNRYTQDRAAMKHAAWSGIPMSLFQVQDLCVWEGAGPIQDRTEEHLVPSDIVIVASRKLLFSAIKDVQEGRDPPHIIRDSSKDRVPNIVAALDQQIPSSQNWKDFCDQLLKEGRNWETVGA